MQSWGVCVQILSRFVKIKKWRLKIHEEREVKRQTQAGQAGAAWSCELLTFRLRGAPPCAAHSWGRDGAAAPRWEG